MDAIEVGGLRIAYQRAGQGPPLVLVHGIVGDGRGTWGTQLGALADEFTVVAWVGPGAGRSEIHRNGSGCRSRRLPGRVRGRPRATPTAHRGHLVQRGAMALEPYRRHPAIPRTLVLAGAYAGWAGSLPPDVVTERSRFCLDVAALPSDEFLAAMLPSMFSPSADPERVAGFAATVREFHPAGFRTMALASAASDLRPMLGHVSVPTRVLTGDRDVRAPLGTAEALHAAIPGSQLTVLEGVGHVSSVEAAERFNSEVRAFLHAVGD